MTVNQLADKVVLDTVRENYGDIAGIRTLQNGTKVKLNTVPLKILQEAIGRIADPNPPIIMNEEKGREEANPNDPEYLQALKDNEQARFEVAVDIMMIEGMELLEGIPPVDDWLPSLKFMAKRGIIVLPEIDWDNEIEVEFFYKKFKITSALDDRDWGNTL